jgi:hypothetical protein
MKKYKYKPFERETPRTIRLPFSEFTKKAQERCIRCIHFYSVLKYNDKFYYGNFCCHWIDIKCLHNLLEDIRKGEEDLCHYRDRNSGHPYNALRLHNKTGYLNLDGDEEAL